MFLHDAKLSLGIAYIKDKKLRQLKHYDRLTDRKREKRHIKIKIINYKLLTYEALQNVIMLYNKE